jgi:catechol 2,3-dioxygenase-like lactoylglutathione lyase family enzyme
MIQVLRLGHATFETPDVNRMSDYYEEVIGLKPVRDKDRAVLSTAIGLEAVVFERGSTARCTSISLQVSPNLEFSEMQSTLQTLGIKSERRSDVTEALREALVFEDPKGTKIELFNARGQGTQSEATGIAPRRLGHIAFLVSDAKAMADFYIKTLGFRVSDWIEDYFAFLRCNPDHHTVNFITGQGPSFMHHIAYDLEDWGHFQRACDVLGRHKRPIIWGPGRHGVGHNIFAYHRDPDDHIIELVAEMDQIKEEEIGIFEPRAWHRDRPQRPKVWERKDAAMTWGPPPTADFLRNQSRPGH